MLYITGDMFPRSNPQRRYPKASLPITLASIPESTVSLPPASTRSQSFSSTSSNTSDLSDTARTIINSLCNDRELSELHQHISPDVSIQYGEDAPFVSRELYLDSWRRKLETFPDYCMDIQETCVDEQQMKVWVRSEITGLPGGIRKESVNMLTFNEEGILVSSSDCQRKLRARHMDR